VFTVEPDAEGTTASGGSDLAKPLNTVVAIFTHTDKHMERALLIRKQGIDASR
jgi:hypothetical protein